jgi:hypothetical protein
MSQHPLAGVVVGGSSFEKLLELAPDVMVGVDRQAIVLANSRPEAVFGLGRAQRDDP